MTTFRSKFVKQQLSSDSRVGSAAESRARQLSTDMAETPALPVPCSPGTGLTVGWSAHRTPEGNEYFYNVGTGETTWSKPTE